jgi:sec-independent protein translocase protein TatA
MGFGNIGLSELIPIFLLVLILFGAKRLPELGKSLGSSIREFKKSMREIQEPAEGESKPKPRESEPPDNRPIG